MNVADETAAPPQQQAEVVSVVRDDEEILPPPPRAADLQFTENDNVQQRLYWDRSHYDSPASQMKALTNSSTLYVGNLSFTTRVSHIRSHFSQLGRVQTIHMGLDRMKKTPCGFCFVQYCSRDDALAAVSLLSSTKLDGRVIRVELDAGFQPGRQYGRGRKGGQVRDDRKPTAASTTTTSTTTTTVDRKRHRPVEATTPDSSYGPSVVEEGGELPTKRRRLE